MPTPSIAEELVSQFYDWETWGRGYALWDAPVRLEPPFEPFDGHYVVYREVPDDGRRPTFLDTLIDLFRSGAPEEETAVAPVDTAAVARTPRYARDVSEILTFHASLPRDLNAKSDEVAAWLMALRALRSPVAFELVGGEKGIVLQLAVRRGDEAALIAATEASFPGLVLAPHEDEIDCVTNAERVGVFEFALKREFMLPLAIPGGDPMNLFVAALEGTNADDVAAVQVLFEGARAPWAESMIRAVTDGEGGSFFENAPHVAAYGKKKALQPLFGVVLRVGIGADADARGLARLRRVTAVLEQFGAPDRNAFTMLSDHHEDVLSDFLARDSHRSGMLLGVDELAGLVHPPTSRVHSKSLKGRTMRRTKAAPETASGLLLGTNVHAGISRPVHLPREWQRRHVHVIGASGSGKTNLLLQLLLRAAERGDGFALLDPHGDLADDLLARLPESRTRDVAILDPADANYPVPFNVFSAHSEIEKTLLSSDLVGIFRRLSTSWGDQMHTVLANAIQALLESERGGTLVDLRRFLVDPAFRGSFLHSVKDEETVYYWTKEFPLLKGQPQSPILTRLDSFLRPKLIRRMVAERENRIDFRAHMDRGGILLARLAQGAIGEENAALLGSFLVAKIHQAAIGRQDLPPRDRRDFLLAIDEFQHFVTPSMASLLSGARKFGIGLVLAHQDLKQVERRDSEVLSALLANAGTRIVFRVGDHDARALAEGFAEFTADDLRTLPIGEAVARFGSADQDFNLAVDLAAGVEPAVALRRRSEIVAASRERYAVARGENRPTTEPLITTPDETPPEVRPETAAPPPAKSPSRPEPREAPARVPPLPPRRKPEEQTLGRGGARHKYFQELVKRFAEARGFRATIEKPTEDGGSVDVALEGNGTSIAVEISVTSTAAYEAGNVVKCLAAGYERIVVLAEEKRHLEAIAKAVRASVHPRQHGRLEFQQPEDFLTSLAAQAPPPGGEEKVGGYKVRVRYSATSDDDLKARQRAVAEVVARSTKKLDAIQ